jgi:hypothetical protein
MVSRAARSQRVDEFLAFYMKVDFLLFASAGRYTRLQSPPKGLSHFAIRAARPI